MFNFLKQYRINKTIKNINSSYVSAQEAYNSDPNLLRPVGSEVLQGHGYSHSKFGPVFSAVRLMSETLARAPLYVGTKDKDNPNSQGSYLPDHRLNQNNSVLKRPNQFYNKQTFWEAFYTTLLITGNVYCVIRRNNNVPSSLHFAELSNYEIRQSKDELGRTIRTGYYKLNVYSEDGKQTNSIVVPSKDVLAVHGPGYNVSTARSPSPLQHAIQRSLKIYEHSLDTQYNNLTKNTASKGIITSKGDDFTPEIVNAIKNKLKELNGVDAGEPWQVMPPSVTFTELNNPAIDSSIFEALEFSVEEVARIYNIPPSLIGIDAPGGGGVGNESVMNYFINNALMPIAERVEDAVYRKIMTTEDRLENNIIRLDLSNMTGGTLSNKIKNAERLVKSSLVTVNEARSMMLGLAPVDGGDILMPIQGAPAPGENADAEERIEEESDDE